MAEMTLRDLVEWNRDQASVARLASEQTAVTDPGVREDLVRRAVMYESAADRLTELAAEVERLRGLVGRLPKYEDTGEPIPEGAPCWYRDTTGEWSDREVFMVEHQSVPFWHGGYDEACEWRPDLPAYSTPAAAEAARNADKEKA